MTEFRPISTGRSPISRTRGENLRSRDGARERDDYLPPPRPHINFIPTPTVLQDLVSRALDALSRGIYWDRGSIVNILL